MDELNAYAGGDGWTAAGSGRSDFPQWGQQRPTASTAPAFEATPTASDPTPTPAGSDPPARAAAAAALASASSSNFFFRAISSANPDATIAVGSATNPMPQTAITPPSSLPSVVSGNTSPYPIVV